MKKKEVVKLLRKDGWYVRYDEGKCLQFRHPLKLGIITISGNPGDKLAHYSLNNILEIAGIR